MWNVSSDGTAGGEGCGGCAHCEEETYDHLGVSIHCEGVHVPALICRGFRNSAGGGVANVKFVAMEPSP